MKCFKMQVYQVLLKCKGTELSFLIWDELMKVKGCFIFINPGTSLKIYLVLWNHYPLLYGTSSRVHETV